MNKEQFCDTWWNNLTTEQKHEILMENYSAENTKTKVNYLGLTKKEREELKE